MGFLKLCAIGRFRSLAHGYLPHRHTDRMLPCASLAKKIARHAYSSCPSLLSNPSVQAFFLFRRGWKRCGNLFIISMLGCYFGLCRNAADRAVAHRPSRIRWYADCYSAGKMRRNGRWSLGWVKMRRPERHKISHGIAAATGLQRTVRSCRGTTQAELAMLPAATGLQRPVPSCRGRFSGEMSVLSAATGL